MPWTLHTPFCDWCWKASVTKHVLSTYCVPCHVPGIRICHSKQMGSFQGCSFSPGRETDEQTAAAGGEGSGGGESGAEGGGASWKPRPGERRQLPLTSSPLSLSYTLCPRTEPRDLLVAPVLQRARTLDCGSVPLGVWDESPRTLFLAPGPNTLTGRPSRSGFRECLFLKNAYSLLTIQKTDMQIRGKLTSVTELSENAVTVWLVSLIAFFPWVVRNFVKSFLSQCSVCVRVEREEQLQVRQEGDSQGTDIPCGQHCP